MNEVATYELVLSSTGSRIAVLKKADNWWSKGLGLMGTRSMAIGEGLWLPGISSIHTLFMHFPLDIVFLSKNMEVLKVQNWIKPGHFFVGCSRAAHTIELRAGTITSTTASIGEKCHIQLISPL
jgi:uncharacterized membrane protein (UPF0127 family)